MEAAAQGGSPQVRLLLQMLMMLLLLMMLMLLLLGIGMRMVLNQRKLLLQLDNRRGVLLPPHVVRLPAAACICTEGARLQQRA